MSVEENIFSVTEINMHLKNVLENNIPPLMIQGEISNFKWHSSGHIYFSLKDKNSSIRAVFFRYQNASLTFQPKNGDEVICTGKITVYERAGNYQLLVSRMYPEGTGILQMKFDALKKKLFEEGLFDEIHKKSIPKFPNSIGIVTSETGAALQDILNILNRRYPVEIFVFPSLVQGDLAPRQLVKGIKYFDQNQVDLIIIGRGGGSQEDLFCFNDEDLARTIFASKIPIISGVGHEIDFTISDFVSDLRAPTPSAAAELAVPSLYEIKKNMLTKIQKIENIAFRKFSTLKNQINYYEKYIEENHPKNRLLKYQNSLSQITTRFIHSFDIVKGYQNRVENLKESLMNRATFSFNKNKSEIQMELSKRKIELQNNVENRLNEKYEIVNNYASILRELSPQKALERGYSILRKENKIQNSVQDLQVDDKVELVLSDGKLNCNIDSIEVNK